MAILLLWLSILLLLVQFTLAAFCIFLQKNVWFGALIFWQILPFWFTISYRPKPGYYDDFAKFKKARILLKTSYALNYLPAIVLGLIWPTIYTLGLLLMIPAVALILFKSIDRLEISEPGRIIDLPFVANLVASIEISHFLLWQLRSL